MDKKTLERLREIGAIVSRNWRTADGRVVQAAARELERLDAERRKDATAFLITGTQLGVPYTDVTQRKEVIDRARSLGYEVSPLFLSPTIQKGMALVSNTLTPNQREVLARAFELSASGGCALFDNLWCDLLAAAQGERK